MATEIADAYIALYTKMPGVKGDIERSLGAADAKGAGAKLGDGLGAGISSRSAAIAGAVGGVVAIVAQKAMSGVTDLIGDAAAASDATDKFKKTLGFAGIDTSTIAKVTKQTRKYADDTVFDLSTIQNTTAQLAANSVPNYEKLTEAAGNLNAVAGGNNDTFSSVAMVLTQTAGAGKLTTENWNQLANAIPGASGVLIKSLEDAGAFTGNFRDAMAKGEITSGEFNDALMKVGSQPIAVEAAKSTSTFEGAVGNLKASIIGGLSDAINGMKPTITGFIGGLSGAVGGLKSFGGWVKDNLTWITPLGIALGVLTVGLQVASTAAAIAVAGGFGKWIAATKIGTAVQAAFNLVMNANPIFLVITAIAALVAGLVYFFTQTELGKQVWENTTNAIGTAVNWLWTTIIQPVFTAIGAIFAWLYQNIILPIVTGIMIYVGLWAAIFTWLWDAVLAPVFQAIGAVFAWIWGTIIMPIVNLIVAYVQMWGAIFTWLWANIISPVFAAIGKIFQWVWNTIIKPVASFIGDAIHVVGDVIHNVFGGISDFIGSAFQSVLSVVRGPINALIDLINGIIGGLNSVHVDIPDWVPMVGGQTFGLHIPKIPRLAEGGIVSARPGGVLATIGEGRYDEAVVPLSPEMKAVMAGKNGSGDRPIMMDGALFGVLREMANGEARIVLNSTLNRGYAASLGRS